MNTYIVNINVMKRRIESYAVKLESDTEENAKNIAINLVAEEGDFNKSLSIDERKKLMYVQSCIKWE